MANSVTARFNDNCKVHVAMSNDTTVTKAVIIDAEGNETDIGGGGGGDFSTATVKITNSTLSDIVVNVAFIALDSITTYISIQGAHYADAEIILYKGASGFDLPDGATNAEVTGDITIEDGYILISGDGTVTIS